MLDEQALEYWQKKKGTLVKLGRFPNYLCEERGIPKDFSSVGKILNCVAIRSLGTKMTGYSVSLELLKMSGDYRFQPGQLCFRFPYGHDCNCNFHHGKESVHFDGQFTFFDTIQTVENLFWEGMKEILEFREMQRKLFLRALKEGIFEFMLKGDM